MYSNLTESKHKNLSKGKHFNFILSMAFLSMLLCQYVRYIEVHEAKVTEWRLICLLGFKWILVSVTSPCPPPTTPTLFCTVLNTKKTRKIYCHRVRRCWITETFPAFTPGQGGGTFVNLKKAVSRDVQIFFVIINSQILLSQMFAFLRRYSQIKRLGTQSNRLELHGSPARSRTLRCTVQHSTQPL